MNKTKIDMPPRFEDLSISTQTVIAYLNCTFNINNLIELLPVEDPPVTPATATDGTSSSTGKDKDECHKEDEEIFVKDIQGVHGKIYQLKSVDKVRGIPSKKGHFRNQINLYIYIIDKMVTVKVLPTGKFHLTGCKTPTHTHKAAIALARLIYKAHTPEKPTFEMENDEPLNITLETVMVNIDFKLDFDIDLKKLDLAMQSRDTEFWSIYDPPVNTSVNVKLPFELPDLIRHDYIIFKNGITKKPTITFIDKCPKANKESKKEHTFLVFSSSKVIQSGRNYNSEMKPVHDRFVAFIEQHRGEIELKFSNNKFDLTKLSAFQSNNLKKPKNPKTIK